MRKDVLVMGFLLLSGIVILAYAAGKQSNRLSQEQMDFTNASLTTPWASLTAKIRDTMLNGITLWVKNHEERLSAFANSSGYPNLTDKELSFTDFSSTRNNNMLTTGMRNGLLTQLTHVVTNHEMRLRAINTKSETVVKATKCQIKPEFTFECKIWDPNAFKARVNQKYSLANSSVLQVKRINGQAWGNVMYFWYLKWGSLTVPAFYDQYKQFINSTSRIPNDGTIKSNSQYEQYDWYVRLNDPRQEAEKIGSRFSYDETSFDSFSLQVYQKVDYMSPHWYTDVAMACYKVCGPLGCSCSDRVVGAKCEGAYNQDFKDLREKKKKECEAIDNQRTCSITQNCQWIEI